LSHCISYSHYDYVNAVLMDIAGLLWMNGLKGRANVYIHRIHVTTSLFKPSNKLSRNSSIKIIEIYSYYVTG